MNDNDRAINETDPAAEAFSRLEGEMALVRRAVEHLAAEKADITIPDYTATLGEMSQRLARTHQSLSAIADKPAMELTPKAMAQQIEYAARIARQTDHEELRGACGRYDHASRELRGLVATVRAANEQRRHLYWAAGGGLLAGCLLWAILPGVILRTLPESWRGPEMMATHIVGEPSMAWRNSRFSRSSVFIFSSALLGTPARIQRSSSAFFSHSFSGCAEQPREAQNHICLPHDPSTRILETKDCIAGVGRTPGNRNLQTVRSFCT